MASPIEFYVPCLCLIGVSTKAHFPCHHLWIRHLPLCASVALGRPQRSRPVKTPWVMDVEMEAEGGTWRWRTRRWRWLKMRSPAEKGSKYNGLLREVFLVEHRHGSCGICFRCQFLGCGSELKDLYGSGLFCNKACCSRANGAKKFRPASQAQSPGEDPVGDGCVDGSGGGSDQSPKQAKGPCG